MAKAHTISTNHTNPTYEYSDDQKLFFGDNNDYSMRLFTGRNSFILRDESGSAAVMEHDRNDRGLELKDRVSLEGNDLSNLAAIGTFNEAVFWGSL